MSVQNNPFREVKLTVYPGEGGTPIILAIRVCAAGEGMVFKPFGLVKGPA